MPIVELRTGETVHTGHLAGLLGGENIADAVIDVIGGLLNEARGHSVLVLPAQMLYLLQQGRPFNILPELRNAATSIAVFGNSGSHWTLYIANTLTRQLYFQDTLGDRPGRSHPVQLNTLRSWLTNNVSDGAPWTIKKMPAPPQSDLNRAGDRGNDCGMGAIYGLMHYIQHGTMIAPRTCPNSRELFHTLRGWVLSVVLSGSLNPPSDVRYIPKALRVLVSIAGKDGSAQSSGI